MVFLESSQLHLAACTGQLDYQDLQLEEIDNQQLSRN
jgi:hypothetical protein